MTPLDYAKLCQSCYSDAPTVGPADAPSPMHVYGNVQVFRGSADASAWLHDFDVTTVNVAGIGSVHAGFWQALARVLPGCLALPRPAAVAGHSLGAAVAILYAGVLAALGNPTPVFAFEPPRLAGDSALRDLLQAHGVAWYATRNGDDVVTGLPPELTLPGPLTAIGHPFLPFPNTEDHHISRVVAALESAA